MNNHSLSYINDNHGEGRYGIMPRLLTVFLGLVFLVAAIGKALDGNNFLAAVQYLSPPFLASVPAYHFIVYALIIFIESFFGVSLVLARKPSRVLLYAVLALLVSFTIILVRMALDPWAPKCGCLGLLRIAAANDSGARIGIVRNLGLMVVCLSLIWDAYSMRKQSDIIP